VTEDNALGACAYPTNERKTNAPMQNLAMGLTHDWATESSFRRDEYIQRHASLLVPEPNTLDIDPSIPHAANGRFVAIILEPLLPGFGRALTVGGPSPGVCF
jgi:hypothetical protein